MIRLDIFGNFPPLCVFTASEVSCMFLTGVDRILGMKVILQMTTGGGMKKPTEKS